MRQLRSIRQKELLESISQLILFAGFAAIMLFELKSWWDPYYLSLSKEALQLVLAAVFLFFISNLIYCCVNLRSRLLLMYIHAGIFLFWLTRPLFSGLLPWGKWWLGSYETTFFALGSICLTLVSLRFGTNIAEKILRSPRRLALKSSLRLDHEQNAELVHDPSLNKEHEAHQGGIQASSIRASSMQVSSIQGFNYKLKGMLKKAASGDSQRLDCIRLSAFLLLLLALTAELLKGYIVLKNMAGLDYIDYYTIDWSSKTPWIIGTLSSMLPYLFAAYLACIPKRRMTVFVLVFYLITTIPMLKIGSRSWFVLLFIFAAFYYVARALIAKECGLDEKWISKKLVICTLLLLPIGIAAMGAMNYLRAGEHVRLDFLTLLADAFYKQGVSFDVFGHAYEVSDKIAALGFKFFSLGGVIDDIRQGFIGQLILQLPSLPDYNSAQLALEGHSYAHTMSYFAHPNYLNGEGYGSSYVLELFADFSYPGIIVGSVLIGLFLCLCSNRIGISWFGGMVALVVAQNVMHMPRGYVNELFFFFLENRFWLAILGIYIGALLLEHVGYKVRNND